MNHHIGNVLFSLFMVGVMVMVCIGLSAYLRPSINTQYVARCISGNMCEVRR